MFGANEGQQEFKFRLSEGQWVTGNCGQMTKMMMMMMMTRTDMTHQDDTHAQHKVFVSHSGEL